jgi:hypothetical protein
MSLHDQSPKPVGEYLGDGQHSRRDTVKNLESFEFSIKNMIELMNYLSR